MSTYAETFLYDDTAISIDRHDSGTVVITFGDARVYANPHVGWTPSRFAAELRRIADELEALP